MSGFFGLVSGLHIGIMPVVQVSYDACGKGLCTENMLVVQFSTIYKTETMPVIQVITENMPLIQFITQKPCP